jgi:hypothetical protein
MSPYTLLFSTTLLSEPLFAALLIGALLLAEKSLEQKSQEEDRTKLALAAGVVMGFAYLARTTGVVALAALPAFFLLRKRPRHGAMFLAGMLPFVAGWMLWVKLHHTATTDPMLMYYVDYLGYQFYNVSVPDLPVLLWKNLDGLIWSLGTLILPRVMDSFLIKIVQMTLGISIISGLVRMARKGYGLSFTLFAAGNCLVLLVWHFPPDPRFLYPLFPLAIAGFWTEMEHLIGLFRAGLHHAKKDQRVAARIMLAAASAVVGISVLLQAYLTFVQLPSDGDGARGRQASQRSAYNWVRNNTAPSAAVLTTLDPLFYLQTGRHAIRLTMPPMFWYREDHTSVIGTFRNSAAYARQNQLGYVYHGGVDFIWGVDPDDKIKIDEAIRTNPELASVFQETTPAVFKVQPSGLAASGFQTGGFQEGVDRAASQHDH